jgi:hypothetical protein
MGVSTALERLVGRIDGDFLGQNINSRQGNDNHLSHVGEVWVQMW